MSGYRWQGLLAVAVALVGTAATFVALFEVSGTAGLYVGEAQVVIFPPRQGPRVNPLASTDEQAVRFASLIDQVVNNAEETPRVTSLNLTLADQGMRHGSVVSLLNLGGQWANDFSRPFIRVEAVDSSEAATEVRLHNRIAQVVVTMNRLQDEAGVIEAHRATAQLLPATPRVWYEGTHTFRALLATALLGFTLTWSACARVGRIRLGVLKVSGGHSGEY